MKKSLLFFALLAGIAVMTGCKKDQDVVTLEAVVDQSQNSKAFFGTDHDHLAYWEAKDTVYVKGENSAGSYTLTLNNPTNTFARIANVPASDVYCAIFPASAVYKMGAPSASGTQALIYFEPSQKYVKETINNVAHQRLKMPMGAVTTDKRLIFKNLCSILRMKVTNNVGCTINVKRITVQGFGVYLAGCAKVTLYEEYNTAHPQPEIVMDDLHQVSDDNVLSLYAPDYLVMESINNNNYKYFDVVVPPFDDANYLIIEVEYSANGNWYYSSDTIRDDRYGYVDYPIYTDPSTGQIYYDHLPDRRGIISVERNKIITVNTNINATNQIKCDYAYLAEGPEFNRRISTHFANFDNISFHCTWHPNNLPPETITQTELDALDESSPWHGWVIVSDDDSPMNIYARLAPTDNTKLQILTNANYMYCQPNSRGMFQNLTSVTTINWNVDPITGYGFQTEDVTDMSYMFAGCTSLSNFSDFERCNFTNVTNMAHMFEGCTSMNNFDEFNGINTHNLIGTGIVAMFKGCTSLRAIDLHSFTTNHITSLSELFMNCTAL